MHILSLKHITKHVLIENIPDPPEFYLPLYGYKGVLKTIVETGQYVKKYELLAQAEDLFSTAMHAPASGIIEGIEIIEGKPHLKLVNDFKETAIDLPLQKSVQLEPAAILEILKQYGIEGSGGARFPTHLKYNLRNEDVDVFIINGAECEPYLTADYALMQNKTEALFKSIISIQKIIKAKKVVFGIEKQNKELVTILKAFYSLCDFPVEIKLLPNTYPQGGELQLIKSITKKELPKGSRPLDHRIVLSNIGTLWAIYNALFHNKPYVERVITLSGEDAVKKGNFYVKIGTPVSHLFNLSASKKERQQIVLGGPMMGKAVTDYKSPVTKGTGGVLILPEIQNEKYNCIECGYCANACPQRLMPMEFARYAKTENTTQLLSHRLLDCIECGACAYICPSDVPLMRSIYHGKEILQNTIAL
ncbi:electron transport complex subunit RsxC [Flavobacterium hercynium]|uniref:Ion-translocating oxidoreductase complex subunit C n=1 Tax=Flavobacterium hercynium TaxID=387094 RepID=A0A226H5R6_9FLAO|nr:electron transport complex subunit RsxC [Flavobacterium hercynium]OXA89532.1 electron transport complex subunit RsxC [Flavobacterium hercynium]SMP35968.1 electron transport complex protein RnfC [Flavobacterium hercynium]